MLFSADRQSIPEARWNVKKTRLSSQIDTDSNLDSASLTLGKFLDFSNIRFLLMKNEIITTISKLF